MIEIEKAVECKEQSEIHKVVCIISSRISSPTHSWNSWNHNYPWNSEQFRNYMISNPTHVKHCEDDFVKK